LYVMEVVFRWLSGSGKGETHFVEEIAGGDAVLSAEGRKPIVPGRGVSLRFQGGRGGHECGRAWRVLSCIGLVAALCGDLLFKLSEAIGQLESLDTLGDIGDQLRESRRFIHRDLACR
jgi:hypothetical protein